jgi:CRISPR-associated endoribonuclease Cas6
MRLKFTLRSASKSINANFYYHLSSAIYEMLKMGSPEFSQFLHNKGYQLETGKNYKLFSFGVEFSKIKVVKDIFYFEDPTTTLYISSQKLKNSLQLSSPVHFKKVFLRLAQSTDIPPSLLKKLP